MLQNILNRPESYRKKVAIFSSVFIFMLIVGIWANINGFFGNNSQVAETPKTEKTEKSATKPTLSSTIDSPTPTKTMSKSFITAFNELKESLASVFVPFITGIEVYDSGEK